MEKPCKKCNGTNFKYRPRSKTINKLIRYCVDCDIASSTRYVKTNRSRYTGTYRLKSTGFTPEHYEQKLVEQDFKCAICDRHISEFKKQLAADHNHDTNEPRGLLCTRCNMMLGYAKDDIDILVSAIEYLKKYQ